jgi:hypothetical protein
MNGSTKKISEVSFAQNSQIVFMDHFLVHFFYCYMKVC